ncbi:MAG: prepilin-type N-terminal cleavage/methylation domain-containing protein [Candidatus Riflebacteria bacterium]|nr:prepilin-type N-terminal cleavage/methylation domain-containing protein [Candidatus Riflebacteria bacterium]
MMTNFARYFRLKRLSCRADRPGVSRVRSSLRKNSYESCKGRRAFTLVEVLISLLIFGIVLSMGYVLLQRTFLGLDRQKQSLDTLHEARYFLAMIERDLREMTRMISLDTVFTDNLFGADNAYFYAMELEIPSRNGKGLTTVMYTYEGPRNYEDKPGTEKFIYRQEKGQMKQALITSQLKDLKIWGTDGTIFRNRGADEDLTAYRNYLRPHYYTPSNSAGGLSDLAKVKGVEVQINLNEMFDKDGKVIKTRTFVTRIYSRILNSKFD